MHNAKISLSASVVTSFASIKNHNILVLILFCAFPLWSHIYPPYGIYWAIRFSNENQSECDVSLLYIIHFLFWMKCNYIVEVFVKAASN